MHDWCDARLQKWYSFLPLKSARTPFGPARIIPKFHQYFVVIFGRLLVAFSNDDHTMQILNHTMQIFNHTMQIFINY